MKRNTAREDAGCWSGRSNNVAFFFVAGIQERIAEDSNWRKGSYDVRLYIQAKHHQMHRCATCSIVHRLARPSALSASSRRALGNFVSCKKLRRRRCKQLGATAVRIGRQRSCVQSAVSAAASRDGPTKRKTGHDRCARNDRLHQSDGRGREAAKTRSGRCHHSRRSLCPVTCPLPGACASPENRQGSSSPSCSGQGPGPSSQPLREEDPGSGA